MTKNNWFVLLSLIQGMLWSYFMGFINFLTLIFILAGAINWGLVGVFKLNFVYEIFKNSGNTGAILERICYIVIGVFGIIGLSFLAKLKALCSKSSKNDK